MNCLIVTDFHPRCFDRKIRCHRHHGPSKYRPYSSHRFHRIKSRLRQNCFRQSHHLNLKTRPCCSSILPPRMMRSWTSTNCYQIRYSTFSFFGFMQGLTQAGLSRLMITARSIHLRHSPCCTSHF